MKPISLFIHAVMALVLLAVAPAGAAPRDPGEAAVLRRLAAPEAARVFNRYNAVHGQKIQHHLAQIYGDDPAYAADAGAPMRPLGDDIVGPVTLRWLARFCRDYGIVAADPDFEQDVVASLEQVAGIARAHKDWVKILFSAEFDDWINGQPEERVRSYKIRRSGAAAQVNALIEAYLKERRPVPARPPAAPLEVTYAFDPARPATQGNLKLVGELLKPLAKQPAKGEDAFSDDVNEALVGVKVDDDTLPLIKRYSRTDMYVLSSELLDRLSDEGMSELAVEGLRPLARGQQFADLEPFETAIAEAAKASQAADEIVRAKRRIVSEARVTRYHIPATLAADLAASAPLAPVLADLFAGIAKVEYPTKELFDKAQEWQVRRALGMCKGMRRDVAGALGNDQLDLLAHVLPAAAKASDGIRVLRALDACSIDQQLDANEYAYHVYLEAAAQLDRKMQLQFANRTAVQTHAGGWAMPGCQCGNGEHDGMVYGFLPLWIETGGKQIDFGMLSRIGLYGLTADDDGVLRGPAGFPDTGVPDALAALMRDAHRHNVKVDWVIGRSDWEVFSRSNKDAKVKLFNNLREKIGAWLKQPLQGGGDGLVRLASLWMDPGAVAGDGVALYFRGFPAADKATLKEFVLKLSADLESMQPKRRLSLIVDQADLGKDGPYGYSDLMDMIAHANKIEGGNTPENRKLMVNDIPVLVMLDEPTQQSKKALRGDIQDALHGMDSMRLLRSIVTVVEYDRVSKQQLTDDIIYAGDNYYGIGFWPLPLAGVGGTNEVNTLLAKNFHPVDGNGEAWDRLVGLLCPQRLWVRWVFWITLLMAIGASIGYFSCSGCNERIDSSGVYFTVTLLLIALPLFPLFALTVSDPVLAPYQSLITLAFAAGCVAVALWVTRYNFNKSRRKLP